jgi:two-component system CheB/CheR fusion protein
MKNLLAGTNIATVFVDQQLIITRFTPSVTKIINLISGDIGRPLAHIVSNLVDYTLMDKDIKAVLDTLVPKEYQVQTIDGLWYMMRIQPYRTVENVIEGAVITFVDISSIKKVQEDLAFSESCYRQLFETVKEGLLILEPESGKIIDANPFIIELLGFEQSQLIGKAIWDIGQFKDLAANRQKFEQLMHEKQVQYDNLPLLTFTERSIEVEFTSYLYKFGHRTIIHCHIRDLTGNMKNH